MIRPRTVATVQFTGLGPVAYAEKSVVRVDVKPVPHERRLTNNSARYPVSFSLG